MKILFIEFIVLFWKIVVVGILIRFEILKDFYWFYCMWVVKGGIIL